MFLCLNCNIIKRHNIWRNIHHFRSRQVGWLVVLRINVDLAIFQPYLDLEAGDNQSLKIQVARPVLLLRKPRNDQDYKKQTLVNTKNKLKLWLRGALNFSMRLQLWSGIAYRQNVWFRRTWFSFKLCFQMTAQYCNCYVNFSVFVEKNDISMPS